MVKNLDACTFGSTPASQYLVRTLQTVAPNMTKSCAVRVHSYNTTVNQIEASVESGYMTAHVAANLLRILRVEAGTIEFPGAPEGKLIGQLLRNVIIGHIKRAIRKTSTLRKIETGNVNRNAIHRKGSPTLYGPDGIEYSICGYPAGVVYDDGDYLRTFPAYEDIADTTTPELLMQRSNRRCLRQQKPHMVTPN